MARRRERPGPERLKMSSSVVTRLITSTVMLNRHRLMNPVERETNS